MPRRVPWSNVASAQTISRATPCCSNLTVAFFLAAGGLESECGEREQCEREQHHQEFTRGTHCNVGDLCFLPNQSRVLTLRRGSLEEEERLHKHYFTRARTCSRANATSTTILSQERRDTHKMPRRKECKEVRRTGRTRTGRVGMGKGELIGIGFRYGGRQDAQELHTRSSLG